MCGCHPFLDQHQVKNSKMGPFTKWSYCALNPFLDDAGIESVKLSKEDFAHFAAEPSLAKQAYS